jgi:DNA-binding MarR family transcriptional regulator
MTGRGVDRTRDKAHPKHRDWSPEEEAYLSIQRTAESLDWKLAELLKPYGITTTQYTVLKILRSAGTCGCACGEIAERMVTRDSDMTRLLDRLEKIGLVTRCREQRDRRVVTTCLTPEASSLLEKLDGPVAGLLDQLLGEMGTRRLNALSELLELARQRAG